MQIGEICNRDVVTADPEATAADLAKIMLGRHVGSVIIVEKADAGLRPVGIVTDRDLVLQVTARGLDPGATTAGDIMNGEPVVTQHSAGILDTMRRMRSHGIRRLPIVDHNQMLIGIVTLDDLIDVIVGELGELSSTIASGQYKEALYRRASSA